MSAPHLELRFPNLRPGNYQVTSDASALYNCVAWAAGVDDEWWWPEQGEYWPVNEREATLPTFILALQSLGYEPCDESHLEPGFEKTAIYVDADGVPTHIARQLASGAWTSKCGKLEDITHSLEGLEGPAPAYGRVQQILRRPQQALNPPPSDTP